jgi:hypothetical protein
MLINMYRVGVVGIMTRLRVVWPGVRIVVRARDFPYTVRIAVTSVAPLMLLYHTDRDDVYSATDVLNLPEEGEVSRRIL